MQPKISIVTPYHNSRRFLWRYVSCMKSQTYTNWVCLLVNDCSTDGSPYELQKLVNGDHRFILIDNTIKKSFKGPAAARNCALSQVTTPYLAFCDIDDYWHPEKLHRQLYFHVRNSLDLSVSAYASFNDVSSDLNPYYFCCPPEHLDLDILLKSNAVPMLTTIISTSILRISFSQIPHEDFLFWLDLFKSNPKLRFGCIPEVLAFYARHPDSISSKKLVTPFWTYRVYRTHGISRVKSLFYLFHWAIYHLGHFLYSKKSNTSSSLGIQALYAISPPLSIPICQ